MSFAGAALGACSANPYSVTVIGPPSWVHSLQAAALAYHANHFRANVTVLAGKRDAVIAKVAKRSADVGIVDAPVTGHPEFVERAATGLRVHIYTNGQPTAEVSDFIAYLNADPALR